MKSAGNLNNHFGLPLQLLRLEREHEIAVIEMGMSHAGEIRGLAALAQPDIGVVTNVAPVHLEFFDSLAEHRPRQVRVDCPLCPPEARPSSMPMTSTFRNSAAIFNGKVVTYGIRKPADVRAENIEPRGLLGSEF